MFRGRKNVVVNRFRVYKKNALVPRAAPKAVGGMELAWGRVERVLEKPTPAIRAG